MEDESKTKALMAHPALSRRAFFGLTAAVGCLHFLGSMTSGRTVIAAYADEAGNVSFEVVVLDIDEIAAFVVDASNNNAAVPGAHIKVTSLFNGKTVEGSTNDKGIWTAKAKDLAQNVSEKDPQNYWFQASAEVTIANYCEFGFIDQFIITGAQDDGTPHILLPTQPLSTVPSQTYVRMACFNGQDMLCTTCNMPQYPDNTDNHTMAVQIAGPAGKSISCRIATDDGQGVTDLKSGTIDASGHVSFEFIDRWVAKLQMATTYVVEYTVDGAGYKTVLKLGIRAPQVEGAKAPFVKSDWCISPGLGAGVRNADGNYDPNFPSDVATPSAESNGESNGGAAVPFEPLKIPLPVLPWGNLDIMANLPWSPVWYIIDPAGGIGIGYKSMTFGPNIDPQADPSPAEGFKNRLKQLKEMGKEKWFDNVGDQLDKLCDGNPARNPDSAFGAKMFANCDITYNYQVGVVAYILNVLTDAARLAREKLMKEGKDVSALNYSWGGAIRGSFNLLITGEIGAQCAAGPIPVIVGLDFLLKLNPIVEIGVEFDAPFKNPKFTLVQQGRYGKGGFTIDITGEAGLSAGIGLKGVASVSVRGYCQIPVNLGFVKGNTDDKKFPHVAANINIGVQLIFQILFIKTRFDMVKPFQKTLYDNWKTSLAESNGFDTDPDFYTDPALDLGEGVTAHYTADNELSESYEVSAELNAQGVLCNIDTSRLALPDPSLMSADRQGVKNPYATTNDSEPFDPRKGLRPNIDLPFADPTANDEAAGKQYSDPRTQIVQLGDYLYYCRLVTTGIEPSQTNDDDNPFVSWALPIGQANGPVTVSDNARDYFFTVDNTVNSITDIPVLCYEQDDEGSRLFLNTPYKRIRPYADEDSIVDAPVADVQIPVASSIGPVSNDVENDIGDYSQSEYMHAVAVMCGGSVDGGSGTNALALHAHNILNEAEDRLLDCDQTNDTVTRTRVSVTPFDLAKREWLPSDILDFALPATSAICARCNQNDVDFAVTTHGDELLFSLVSTAKPLAEIEYTVQQMKSMLFTTAMRYKPEPGKHTVPTDIHCNAASSLGEYSYEWKSAPFVMNRKGSDGIAKEYIGVVAPGPNGTRAGGVPDDVFKMHYYPSNGSSVTACSTEGYQVSANTNTLGDTNVHIIRSSEHPINDDGVMQVFVQEREGTTDALQISWEYAQSYVPQTNDDEQQGSGTPVQSTQQRAALWSIDTDGEGSILTPNNEPTYFVGTDKYGVENYHVLGGDKGIVYLSRETGTDNVKLMNVTMNDKTGLPNEPKDLGYVNANCFNASPDGNFLYTVSVKEGSAQLPDDETARSVRSSLSNDGGMFADESGFCATGTDLAALSVRDADPTVKQYQLIACRWDGKWGRFREFFPLAQLSSAPDNITACSIPQVSAANGTENLGGMGVVYSTITKLQRQQARHMYMEIPPTQMLQFNGAVCFDAFIPKNKAVTIHPEVRVTNVGSLPISGFTVVFEVDGKEVGSYKCEHLETIVVKPLRPQRGEKIKSAIEEQGLTYEEMAATSASIIIPDEVMTGSDSNDSGYSQEDEAILWPGSERTYRTEVTTPDTWDSEKTVTVSVRDYVTPDFKKNDEFADVMFENESKYVTIVDPATYDIATSIAVEEAFKTDFDFAPIAYEAMAMKGVSATTRPVKGIGYTAIFKAELYPSSLRATSFQWQYSTDLDKTWADCTNASATCAYLKETLTVENRSYSYRCVVAAGGTTYTSNSVGFSIASSVTDIFPDVVEGEWYVNGIQFAYDKNIMGGYTAGEKAGLFGPYDNLTRAQAVTVLWRYATGATPESSTEANATSMPDVADNDYYTAAVNWAWKRGIVTGYMAGDKAGCFGPDDAVTREQFAVMMYRMANIDTAIGTPGFPDVDQVSDWALDAMKWAVANGIITGVEEGDTLWLRPQSPIWRASAATMVQRYDNA